MYRIVVAFHIKIKLESQINPLVQGKMKYLEVVYWVN